MNECLFDLCEAVIVLKRDKHRSRSVIILLIYGLWFKKRFKYRTISQADIAHQKKVEAEFSYQTTPLTCHYSNSYLCSQRKMNFPLNRVEQLGFSTVPPAVKVNLPDNTNESAPCKDFGKANSSGNVD